MLIVKSNQYEANLLYKQVSQMIDEALYFPVDESYRIESLAVSRRIIRTKIRNDVSTYTTWSTSFD